MKRIVLLFAIIIMSISFIPAKTNAAEILNDIKVEAKINQDGTIDIKQKWSFDDSTTDGTEHYINLNASFGEQAAKSGSESITNYKVFRNGKEMKFMDSWDVNASFKEKAGKFGVIPITDEELELTFGITEKTKNDFVIQYKVHNAIKETNDGYKYMHWTFLPTDINPQPNNMSAHIDIEGNLEIDKIYGFNYKGDIVFKDDKSALATMNEGAYTSQSTLNIFTLINDKDGLLKTSSVAMSMQEKIDEMFEGSDYNPELFFEEDSGVAQNKANKRQDFIEVIFNIITSAFVPVIVGITILGVLIGVFKNGKNRQLINSLSDDEKKKLKDKEFYYRDKPDNIILYSSLLKHTDISRDINENILAYFIAKWTSDDVFRFIEEGVYKEGLFRKSKGVKFKVIYSNLKSSSELEGDLFGEFYRLADGERMINTIELRKMDMSNIAKILSKHEKEVPKLLIKENYAVQPHKEPMSFTDEGKDILFQHLGLKNYLKDFTLINERSASEIELWDYYFHMASFYGIADEFKEQLKLAKVDMGEDSMYNRYYGTRGSGLLVSQASRTVSDTYTSHMRRSSGGGGSSSSGGGGGSSGGGSGGGTR